MHDVNWWLMALAFVCGLAVTLALMVRRVTREVPVYGALGRRPGAGDVDESTTAKLATRSAAAVAATTAKIPRSGDEPYGAGSIRVPAATDGPKGYTVKGNEDSMLYHTPESPSYKQTLAEVWFRDVDSAERAGFSRWDVGEKAAGMAGLVAAGGAAAAAGAAATTAKIPRSGDEPYGAGSMRVAPTADGRKGYTIKGNEDSMLYHTPESPSYKQTIAEVWFKDESTAERAAFTRWDKGRADGGGSTKFADLPPGPHGPGSANPAADGSGPEGWTVKGNEDSMLYHSSESPSYKETIAEVWFRDVETAEKAGFARWDSGKSQRG
jgi:uncharacterized membrane protein ArfC